MTIRNREGKPIRSVRGHAWSGAYADGKLGFCMPAFVSEYGEGISPNQDDMLHGRGYYPSNLYRVEVTVRLVPDKNGRPIVRRNKKRLTKAAV